MKAFISLKSLLGLLLILNLQSTILNKQSLDVYAQNQELFEHTWFLEEVVIENESYYIVNFTANIATIIFFEDDEKVEVFLCEFDNFESDIDFTSSNSFEIFNIELNPFFGDCEAIEEEYFIMQNAYFSIFLEKLFLPKNPFTYAIEAIDDYYQLTIENSEGDWAVYNSVLLSTSDFSMDSFTLYPNPAKEILHISSTANQVVNAAIYDLNGKLIQRHAIENKTTTLDVKNLKQGLYFIVFEAETGERLSKKFVKQ